MKLVKSTASNQKGFTLIETVVTLIISSIFVVIIINLFIYINSMNASSRAYYAANLLAYNNMRTYANSKSPTWFLCHHSHGSTTPDKMTLINRVGDVTGIPSPVKEVVIAEAPYGCGDGNKSGKPIKITSTVTYGNLGKKIVHATYSTY